MEEIRIYAFADEAGSALDVQIQAMVRNGLKGLEIRNVDGTNGVDLTADQAREIRRKMDDAGLVVWSMGSPIGKIDIAGGDFPAHLDRFRRSLEIADILGARRFRIFSFFMPKDQSPEQYKNQVFDQLAALMDAAKDSGILLCHENEKGIYGDIAPRCLEIMQAFPQMGFVFDPANFIQCGQETWSAWQMLKPYTKYMHIKDALSDGSVVPAGCGTGHVREIASDFISSGGRDFTMEPHLTQFEGLSALEREDRASKIGHKYVYNSMAEAFDAACGAFRALATEIAAQAEHA